MAPIIAFLPLITAGIGAATAGIALAEMPSAPAAPTAVADTTNAAKAQADAAQAQAHALTQRRGMASTQLTSPLGTQGSASTQKSTLGA